MFEPLTPQKYSLAKNDLELTNALNSDQFIIQLKRDGVSYCLTKDSNGEAHLWGDKISKKTGEVIDKIENFQYIKKWILNNFPNETMILAELYTFYDYTTGEYKDRETSKYMNSLCLCNPEKCNARIAATTEPKVYLFDLLWLDGVDYRGKSFSERDCILDDFYLTQKDSFHLPWLEKAHSVKDNKLDAVTEWLKQGLEGGVLKRIDAPHAWAPLGATAHRPVGYSYKIKSVNTVDMVITGVYWPEKEYKGKDPENAQYRDEDGNPVNRLWALGYINSIGIGLYKNGELVEAGSVASGLNDEVRAQIAENPDNFIGQTVECACMSVDKTEASLRHPRFMCFRPDKAPTDCRWEDVFE